MAKKIEGMAHQYAEENILADGNTSLVATDSYSAKRPGTMYTVSGTLILHDGPHEPTYTATEVRAMAVSAMQMIRSAAKTGIHVGQACGYIGKAMSDAGINITHADVMGMAVPKSDHHDPEGTNP